MKKKVNLIAHALFVFMTVSGTCTPLIANAEQLVSSEETRVGLLVGTSENLNDTQSASAVEASNATTPTVQDTMEQNDVVKEQTPDSNEPVIDQPQDTSDSNEPTVDQPQGTSDSNEPTVDQPQDTSDSNEPVVDQSQDTENQDDDAVIKEIGKGENFDGKLYLNYIGGKLKDVFNNSSGFSLVISLRRLLNDQLSEENVKERFDVEVDTIRHLIATYVLYDIAFAKDSAIISALGQQNNDGTSPETYTGFYPNTQQLKDRILNNQDGKMMDAYSYYVDQKSDKTVIIHGGFRGNWNNGIVMDEYNDFYQAGYNMIFVDPRATGASGGDFVTYGEYESDDVLHWINYEVNKNPQQKILLYGGSMGAATMMSVLAKKIPANVKGIIENCGFKSIDEQLRFTYNSTIAPMLAPIFGDLDIVADKEHEDLYLGLLKEYYFDREMHLNTIENLPVQGMMSSLPKLIIHGSEDNVVPVSNAQELFDLSGGYKDLLIVEGAGHGEAQTVAPQAYQQHVTAFMDMVFNRSVTVKYVDENNQSLLNNQESILLKGAYGDSYQTEQKEFSGYDFVKVEGADQGVFNETNPIIVYHYKKSVPKENNNGQNGENGQNSQSGSNGNNSNNINHKTTNKVDKKKNNKEFPQTGEQRGIKMSIIGSVLMILLLLGCFYQKRKGGKAIK